MRTWVGHIVLLVVVLVFGTEAVGAQAPAQTKFEHLSTSDGLSNHQISQIYQDDMGYIWIGTIFGLNRFDGHEVRSYFYNVDDSLSLPSNTINWLAKGPDGNMWIQAVNRIVSYNPYAEAFYPIDEYLELLQTDAAFITKIIDDNQGNYWFVITNRGVVKMRSDHSLVTFGAGMDSDVRISSDNVTDIYLDQSGMIWVVNGYGTTELIDPQDDRVKRKYGLSERFQDEINQWNVFVDSDKDIWLFARDRKLGLYYMNTESGESKILGMETLSSDVIHGMIEMEAGVLWIGTDHGGVTILDKKNWKATSIQSNPDVPKSLSSNNVNCIIKDKDDGIWIGTAKSSVNYLPKGSNNFAHYKVSGKSPAFNDMSSFAEDKSGNLWIGTNGKGLLFFDRKSQKFRSISEDAGIGGFKPSIIVSLLYDSQGSLWVGTYLDGLYRFDGRQFRKFEFDVLQQSDLSVWELFEDSKGNIWIGTLKSGIIKYDPKTGEQTNFSVNDYLPANYVTTIEEDYMGRIWIGTGVGIALYEPNLDQFRTFQAGDTSMQYPISSNSIISITTDSKNRTWVATLDGLNRYDEDIEGFSTLKEKDGLPSNIIYAIQEDQSGKFWLSTSQGITRMSINQGVFEFQSFDLSDGLQGENFTEDASFKTADGYLIFSGQNGFNMFSPEDIEVNEHRPNLFFTQLVIAGRNVVPGGRIDGDILLKGPLQEAEEMTLSYKQNSFIVQFVAISYYQSDQIRYQYQLEGFDQDWRNVSSDIRQASFSNLDYGDYKLKVRVSTQSSVWPDDHIELTIHILPPFWSTIWAYLIYTLAIVGLLYLSRRYIVRRERKRARLENDQREIERQRQLDMLKIKFFTNISHEFRTPLSLVVTPIERMLRRPDEIKPKELELVQRNAKRLMNLVNQLLDFRKMEANQHILNQSSGDIVSFLQGLTDSFSDLSREKSIKLSFDSDRSVFYTFFDKDKLEKIMFNLLSNAFKFTMSGGEIRVDFEVLDKSDQISRALILVTDTGIGIPPDKQKLIFNRFFQNDTSEEIINNGTGIGLSITREFVELHGGTVHVESKPGVGSTFIVELPLKEINSDEEIAEELVKELTQNVELTLPEEQSKPDMPIVLLVEDNFDFRFYLSDNLKQYYNIQTASNGKEAWRKIKSDPPDMIISDVMMPVMDGIELCEKVKADPRTSHLPIILLTAKSSVEHRIEGLNAGAIEYISKPFNFEILLSTIESALRFHDRVRESGQTIKARPGEIEVVSQDEILVKKAVSLVEANMSNSDFTVEDMSHELGYSRGHLYEKILRITHETPIDFIRNIRMQRAADLLLKSQLNISEIAYKVGYNNPKLFSRYFKSRYNCYPSEYRSQNKD